MEFGNGVGPAPLNEVARGRPEVVSLVFVFNCFLLDCLPAQGEHGNQGEGEAKAKRKKACKILHNYIYVIILNIGNKNKYVKLENTALVHMLKYKTN